MLLTILLNHMYKAGIPTPPCYTLGKHWLCLNGSFLRVLWLVVIFVTWEIQIFGSRSVARNVFFFLLIYYFVCAFTYMCVFLCVDLLVPHHMCEGQRTTWWTHFFPIIYHMVLRTKLSFLGLVATAFTRRGLLPA